MFFVAIPKFITALKSYFGIFVFCCFRSGFVIQFFIPLLDRFVPFLLKASFCYQMRCIDKGKNFAHITLLALGWRLSPAKASASLVAPILLGILLNTE
jgi:hypothetical protein